MRVAWIPLLLLAGLAACQRVSPLKIFVPENMLSAVACIAQNSGVRGMRGEGIELVWGTRSEDALTLLKNNQVDLAVLGLPAFVTMLADRPDLRIVSETMSSTRNLVLAMRPRSEIKTLKQLAGKRIGFVPGTSPEIFLEYFLLTEGVNLGSVTKIPLPIEQLKKQFISGKLDAVIIAEPDLSRLKAQHSKIGIIEFDGFVHESKGVLAAGTATLERHAPRIDKLLQTWIAAEQWGLAHPVEAQALYAKCFKVDAGAMGFMGPALAATRPELKLTHSLRHVFERNRDWLIQRKNFSEEAIPVFATVIDSSFLDRARPRAVTIKVRDKR